MNIPYSLHAINDIGLTAISAHKASELITKYNIYFRLHCIPIEEYAYRNFDFDLLDNTIYKLDNSLSFDKQYNSLKTILLGYESKVYFYTDFVENKEILLQKIRESHTTLKNKNISITLTNLTKESKVKKPFVQEYIESLEKYKTGSLF